MSEVLGERRVGAVWSGGVVVGAFLHRLGEAVGKVRNCNTPYYENSN
jgi:hypothetical protein